MRGRPLGSQVRQNIIEILYFLKSAHGYKIYEIYKNIFPSVSIRNIYYHLNKGEEIGEFEVEKIKKEKGDYSWGSDAEKIYYKLGPKASPTNNEKARLFLKNEGYI